jgi:hypothetical protein
MRGKPIISVPGLFCWECGAICSGLVGAVQPVEAIRAEQEKVNYERKREQKREEGYESLPRVEKLPNTPHDHVSFR